MSYHYQMRKIIMQKKKHMLDMENDLDDGPKVQVEDLNPPSKTRQ